MVATSDALVETTARQRSGLAPGELFERILPTLTLPERSAHLVMLGVLASPSANASGVIGRYVELARAAGVPDADILEARKLGSAIALHGVSWGLERLAEELREQDSEKYGHLFEVIPDLGPNDHTLTKPYPGFAVATEFAPQAHAVVRSYHTTPTPGSAVTPLERELIFLAIDLNCSHMLARGVGTHARLAMGLGASVEHLTEVGILVTAMAEISFL